MSRSAQAIEHLLAIMERFRGPGGCPWDREQTLARSAPTFSRRPTRSSRPSTSRRRGRAPRGARRPAVPGGLPGPAAARGRRLRLRRRGRRHRRKARVPPPARLRRLREVRRRSSQRGRPSSEKKRKAAGRASWRASRAEVPALLRAERLTDKASRSASTGQTAGARDKVTRSSRARRGDRRRRQAASKTSSATRSSRSATWPATSIAPEDALRAHSDVRCPLPPCGARLRAGRAAGGVTLEEMDALWDEAKSLERQAKTALVPPIPGSPQTLGKVGG